MQTLRKGDKGAEVKYLQQRLNHFGFHVSEDGDFGQGTENAVVQFQASRVLTADGAVGAQTWQALLSTGAITPPPDLTKAWRGQVLAWVEIACATLGYGASANKVLVVLQTAVLDYGAKEVPAGSNGGPEIAHLVGSEGPPSAYYKFWGVTDKDILRNMPPWCAIAVSSWLRRGLSLLLPMGTPLLDWSQTPFGHWYGAVADIEKWGVGRKTALTKDQADKILPGMIFTMSRAGSSSDVTASPSAGHTGLVLKVHPDGTFDTIEGNVGDKVGTARRKIADMRYFIWWW